MMTALPIQRHDEILRSGLHVLVFRVAESPACQRFQPELEALAARRPDIAIWTVEAMEQRELAERHGLRALPTVVIYRDGLPCRRYAGAQPGAEIEAGVDEVAGADMAAEHNDWMVGMLETGEAGSPYVSGNTPKPAPRTAAAPAPAMSAATSGTLSRSLSAPMRSLATTPLRSAATRATAGATATKARPLGTVRASAPPRPRARIQPLTGLIQVRRTAPETEPEGVSDEQSILRLADTAWYAGDSAAAIHHFTTLLLRDPASWQARNARGQVLADHGGGALALADLDRVVAEHPDGDFAAYARSARALALAQVGRHEEADQDIAAALAVTPENAWAHLRQARIHELRGHRDPMAASLRRALEAESPRLTESQRALAQSLLLLA